jgi:hypothetical protein
LAGVNDDHFPVALRDSVRYDGEVRGNPIQLRSIERNLDGINALSWRRWCHLQPYPFIVTAVVLVHV